MIIHVYSTYMFWSIPAVFSEVCWKESIIFDMVWLVMLNRPAPVPAEGSAPVTGHIPGQQLVDPAREPPVRGGVPLGPIGLVQPNGVPLLGQEGGGPDQRRVIRRLVSLIWHSNSYGCVAYIQSLGLQLALERDHDITDNCVAHFCGIHYE